MSKTASLITLDQGTGSTRSALVNVAGEMDPVTQRPIDLASPHPGWVEQDPEQVFEGVAAALNEACEKADGPVAGVGISNQRESALAWDAGTGQPLSALLGWQDRRTAKRCQELKAKHADRVRKLSGLPLDPMFSALKIEWILDRIDPDRSKAKRGQIRVGTVDAWLVQRLTGDDRIEAGNASRTQLLNIRNGQWDPELLEIFNIPARALPQVVGSDVPTSPIKGAGAGLEGVRITGILGDSHAALFAHGVREPGSVKVTYGTGSSIMGLASEEVGADSGLVETIGWQRTKPVRAFEGNILSTGGTLVWLGKILGCSPKEIASMAQEAKLGGGVNVVPAFSGLGAPWWDEGAKAIIDGFDLGTDSRQIARAAVESIALQIEDVLTHADQVSGRRIDTVLVDGGPAGNNWLMQFQADLGQRRILRPFVTGLSALGAAHLAGLGAGVWDEADLASLTAHQDGFTPGGNQAELTKRRASWKEAVARSRMRTECAG